MVKCLKAANMSGSGTPVKILIANQTYLRELLCGNA